MKLTDLNPRWWNTGGERRGMGVSFDCPHCRTQRIGVAFANPLDSGPPASIEGGHDGIGHLGFRCAPEWQRTGETFETLTLSPSVDTSKAGHWHGWVRNGEVTTC
jgi:hypothetical protein